MTGLLSKVPVERQQQLARTAALLRDADADESGETQTPALSLSLSLSRCRVVAFVAFGFKRRVCTGLLPGHVAFGLPRAALRVHGDQPDRSRGLRAHHAAKGPGVHVFYFIILFYYFIFTFIFLLIFNF